MLVPCLQRLRTALRSGGSAQLLRCALPLPRCSAPSRGLALIPFKLSDIGEGIAEVEVLKWHVKVGDSISQFDKIVEVQSDKATVDITSRYDGVVRKLYYAVGDMAKTGTVLVDLERADAVEGAPAAAAAAAAPAPAAGAAQPLAARPAAAAAAASPSPEHLRGLAAPSVRRIAREHNLSVGAIAGSGKDGRVTKEDILAVVGGAGSGASATRSSSTSSSTTSSGATQAAAPAGQAAAPSPAAAAALPLRAPSTGQPREDRAFPVRGLQRAMAKSMAAAWVAPHFGFADEVILDPLLRTRDALRRVLEPHGLRLTFLPLLIKAASLALARTPALNGRLDEACETFTHMGAHNVGVAMDTPRGLIVPNIKNVGELSVLEIALELKRLQGLAQGGALKEADLVGGTFTLSNIGTIGGTYMAPVIPPGTVAIGALGKVSVLPRFASTLPGGKGDAVVAASVLTVSWAADHRIIDGAMMARFSADWKRYVEAPDTMLLELR